MNGFHSRGLGMSSQLPIKTSRKKTARGQVRTGRPSGDRPARTPTLLLVHHGLEVVAVEIVDVGRVVARGVVFTRTGRPIVGGSRGQRLLVERPDGGAISGHQGDVHAHLPLAATEP